MRMKSYYGFTIFVLALVFGGSNGERANHTKHCSKVIEVPREITKMCPGFVPTKEGPFYHDALIEATYKKLRSAADTVVHEICSAFPKLFLKYNARDLAECKTDVKEALFDDISFEIFHHKCSYHSLVSKILQEPGKWDASQNRPCKFLTGGDDALCPTAANMVCKRLDNRMARAYCNSRLRYHLCVKDVHKTIWNEHFQN